MAGTLPLAGLLEMIEGCGFRVIEHLHTGDVCCVREDRGRPLYSARRGVTVQRSGGMSGCRTEVVRSMANIVGKRYFCAVCRSEFIVTKSGEGTLTCHGQPMAIKDAQPAAERKPASQ